MKKNFIIATALAAFLLASCETQTQETTQQTDTTAGQQQQNQNQMTGIGQMEPQEFVEESAEHNLFEIQLAQLAQEKAQTKEVKEFAKTIASHHQENMKQLQKAAGQYQVPDSLSSDKQGDLDDLREKSGIEFDNEYMDMVVDAHEDAVGTYTDAAEDLQDTTLVNYAANTIPEVKSHLQKAKEINQKVEETAQQKGNKNVLGKSN